MVGIKSDVGSVRTLNEDYAGFIEENNYKLYIVADGMGGHNAGEVASKLAVDCVKEYIENDMNTLDLDSLEKAIKYANDKIFNYSRYNEGCQGMGTTLTACMQIADDIIIANVGDSSCFGIKDDKIIKITKDHSLVQELIDSGTITEKEGRNHPKKNVITRALGTSANVDVDVFFEKSGKYSKFLVCSDGLSNEVDASDILNTVKCSDDLNLACEKLVSLAKDRGGRDNITVLLFGGEV